MQNDLKLKKQTFVSFGPIVRYITCALNAFVTTQGEINYNNAHKC